MNNDDFLKCYEGLINLGFSDEISLEAAQMHPDLEQAINYVYNKSSTYSDPTMALQQNGPKSSMSFKPHTESASNIVYQPSPSKAHPPANYFPPSIQNSSFLPPPAFSPANSGLSKSPPIIQNASIPPLPSKNSTAFNGQQFISPPKLIGQKLNPSQNPIPSPQLAFPPPQYSQSLQAAIPPVPTGPFGLPPSLPNPLAKQGPPSFPPQPNGALWQVPPHMPGAPLNFHQPYPLPPPQSSAQLKGPAPIPSPPALNSPLNNNLPPIPSYLSSPFNQNLSNPSDVPKFPDPKAFASGPAPANFIPNKQNTDIMMKTGKIEGSEYNEHKLPEDENFSEFLVNCLRLRGQDEDFISAISGSCSSKEEALLNLDIPTSYKSVPFSEIPSHYIFPVPNAHDSQTNSNTPNLSFKIMQDLLDLGVSQHLAEDISATCSTLEEAIELLFGGVEDEVYSKPAHKPRSHSNEKKPYKKNPIPNLPNYSPLFPGPPQPPYMSSMQSMPSLPPPPVLPSFPHHPAYGYGYNQPHQRPLVLNEPCENDPKAPEIKTNYFESLKNFRLVLSESPETFRNFQLGLVASSGAQFTRRINSEIKSIESTVPCDSTASIFTLIDQQCMHRIYFLLSGTIDTPYSHGLYLFEVLLPQNYPNNPPKVNIRTTGGGSMRFNPNLYSNGYVCLSIINTWSGRPEEQWNPSSSTLLQVMLSIQSLVMDSNIIHKEPGFENYPPDCQENLAYQYEVKYGNIKYAMIENIKHPPLGFEEVVRSHFKHKKQEILQTVERWVQEIRSVSNIGFSQQNPQISSEINHKGPFKAFSALYSELNSLLDKL